MNKKGNLVTTYCIYNCLLLPDILIEHPPKMVYRTTEISFEEVLKTDNYNYCDGYAATDKKAAALFAYSTDVYLRSVNAITEDGILVNIDCNSNREST